MITRTSQRGQALVLGMLVLVMGVAALLTLFNTGQLVREKTQLTNAADAAAYSGGLLEARAMNFTAYANRAMIANTVAIAQMTALLSWDGYVRGIGAAYRVQSPSSGDICLHFCVTAKLRPLNLAAVYGGNAVLQAFTTQSIFDYYDEYASPILQRAGQAVAYASDGAIRLGLQPAIVALHATLPFERASLIQAVAQANFSEVRASDLARPVVTASVLAGPADGWLTYRHGLPFNAWYRGDDRKRFGDTSVDAARRDAFLAQRDWDHSSIDFTCVGTNGQYRDHLVRGGGTNLHGLDEWEAVDTLGWHQHARGSWGRCKERERVFSYAAAAAGGDDYRGEGFGRAADNATAYAIARSGERATSLGYTGLPATVDLGQTARNAPDPRVRFSVEVGRDARDLRTTNGASSVKPWRGASVDTAGVTPSRATEAVSTAEVYFDRTSSRADGKQELASLYNPFWEVHLVEPDPAALVAAAVKRALQ